MQDSTCGKNTLGTIDVSPFDGADAAEQRPPDMMSQL